MALILKSMKYIYLIIAIVAMVLMAGCAASAPPDFVSTHTRNITSASQYNHIAVAYIPTGDEYAVYFRTHACCHTRIAIEYDLNFDMPVTRTYYDSYNVGEQTFTNTKVPVITYLSGEPDSGRAEFVYMQVSGVFNESFNYNLEYEYGPNGKIYEAGTLIRVQNSTHV